MAATVAGSIIVLALGSANTRASEAGPERDSEDITDPFETRWFTNHAGGYYVCSHSGCQKKVKPAITNHDCCGRCWPGRKCMEAAQRDYDGPGYSWHTYCEALLYPGECAICGEPPEAHPKPR
jgi:hypothetical protein